MSTVNNNSPRSTLLADIDASPVHLFESRWARWEPWVVLDRQGLELVMPLDRYRERLRRRLARISSLSVAVRARAYRMLDAWELDDPRLTDQEFEMRLARKLRERFRKQARARARAHTNDNNVQGDRDAQVP